jgi:hypothetical protein
MSFQKCETNDFFKDKVRSFCRTFVSVKSMENHSQSLGSLPALV